VGLIAGFVAAAGLHLTGIGSGDSVPSAIALALAAGVHIVDVSDSLPALSAAVGAGAYYIAQEAPANVHRHAQATACRLRLTSVGPPKPALELEIVDNGPGLPPRSVGRGLCLRLMTERAAELGGEFDAGDRPGGGLRIWARLPIGTAAAVVPIANGGTP
jgi:signal transduction histidine kinase